MANLTRTIPGVPEAKLPVVYESAKTALATCERIDECKDWANKAEAIASYARQSEDDTLMNHAMRIKARAIQRCGELLKEIEASQGGRPRKDLEEDLKGAASAAYGVGSKTGSNAAPSFQGRLASAAAAGLSRDQAKQAIRVANVPEPVFREMVEGREKPATITELAERGKKPSTAHLNGRDPKDFAEATKGCGVVRRFVEEAGKVDVKSMVRGMSSLERRTMGECLPKAREWLSKLEKEMKS